MALPAGALQATVTAGGSVGVAGTAATVSELTVALDLPAAHGSRSGSPRLVWGATGIGIESIAERPAAPVTDSLTVLADQPGVLASSTVNGQPALVEIRGWPMVARWRVTMGNESRVHVRRFSAPAAGTVVDLDLLPEHGAHIPGPITYAQTINVGGGASSAITADDTPAAPAEGESASYFVTAAVSWPAGLVWSTDPDGGVAPTITGTALVSMFTVGGTTRAILGATFPGVAAPADTTAPNWSATFTMGTPTQSSVVATASALATDNVGVAGYEVSYNGGSSWAAIVPSGLNFTLSGSAGTTYATTKLRAKDAAGNTSTPVLSVPSYTMAASADVTAPTVGTMAASAITSSGFTLTVSSAADEAGGSGLHATPYAFTTDGGTTYSAYQSSPVYAVTGKVASTGYSCNWRVRDAAGNVSTGTAQTVTTMAADALGDWMLSGGMSLSGAGVIPDATDGGIGARIYSGTLDGKTVSAAVLTADSAGKQVIPCLVFRYVNATNYCYASWNANQGYAAVYAVTSGTHTLIGATIPVTIAATPAMVTAKVSIAGNTVTVYDYAGGVLASRTVTQNSTATGVGVRKGGTADPATVYPAGTPWTVEVI